MHFLNVVDNIWSQLRIKNNNNINIKHFNLYYSLSLKKFHINLRLCNIITVPTHATAFSASVDSALVIIDNEKNVQTAVSNSCSVDINYLERVLFKLKYRYTLMKYTNKKFNNYLIFSKTCISIFNAFKMA